MSKGITKEDGWFDYTEIPSYLKSNNESYEEKDKDVLKWVCEFNEIAIIYNNNLL